MSHKALTSSEYDRLTREQLLERLVAAEKVCTAYGIVGGGEESERAKSLYMLWRAWHRLPSVEFRNTRWHHLTDDSIYELAAARDEIRQQTLLRIKIQAGTADPS